MEAIRRLGETRDWAIRDWEIRDWEIRDWERYVTELDCDGAGASGTETSDSDER